MEDKNKQCPLAIQFSHVSLEHLPKDGSKAYILLCLLLDGATHSRSTLVNNDHLGETLRSPLQLLKGDRFGCWLIHSVLIAGQKNSALQLDSRHLSGEPLADAEARMERRKQLKEESAKEATHGRIREPKAIREMSLAQAEYFKSLGDAVNEPNFKK